MAAILRVKRKKDDEPLDALLIACKRQKTAQEAEKVSPPLTATFKFAGTVKNQEDNVVEHITKTLCRDELKATYKQHVVDISKKNREQTKQDSTENRYKIVNSFRSLNTAQTEELKEDVINIIDVEDARVTADKKDDAYVYDLYYTRTQEELNLDYLVSIQPIEQELVFEDYRDNPFDLDYNIESDDSNSESNWRNDYPDESDHSDDSMRDNDIRRAVRNLTIDEDNVLSSDDDEFFGYNLDQHDVDRYGYKYARYKARIARQQKKSSIDSEDQEEDERQPSESEDYSYEYRSEEEM